MDTFVSQFEKCLSNYSDNTAVIFCDEKEIIDNITYEVVCDISEQIKTVLYNFVNPKNVCIAIVTGNAPINASIILGVHKHGSPFIFIDPSDPSSKVSELCHRIGLKWILKCRNEEETTYGDGEILQFASEVTQIKFLNKYEIKLYKTDAIEEPKIYNSNISYVIQTSGTTGENKIVNVTHDCIMSNINSFRKIFNISTNDIIYQGTILTFDPSIIEIFLPLTTGATLLMVPTSIKNNRNQLYQILFPKNLHPGVTFLQFPPSVFLTFPKEIIQKIICENSSLRILALGGERFPEKLLDYENCNKLKIYNLYGITEMSCWASVEKIEKGKNISIGKPLDDTIFEVRHKDGNILDCGEGELYIGSKKRISFIDSSPVSTSETIFHFTGDIVKVENGGFYYLGRKNSIIKRFGHKVCLSQIEKTVYDVTGLNSKCLWDKEEQNLILFAILKETDPIVQNKIIDKLRIKLLKCLKIFEMPDITEIIPNIPLTKNGKTNFNTLLKISKLKNRFGEHLSPIDYFQNLFAKYFGLSFNQLKSLQNNSFLDFGGNSILAIQINIELEKIFETKSNCNTSDLLGYLLDKNVSYKACCDYVEEQFCSKNYKRKISNEILGYEEKKETDISTVKILKKNDFAYGLKINWKYNMSACIDASPVLVENPKLGKLLVIGSHSHSVAILDATTGDLRHEISLPDTIEISVCSTLCKNYVMVGCNDGVMYNLNLLTSKINWKFQAGKDESAIKCTPILCKNNTCIVFGAYDRILYCLSIKDGQLVWKNEISEIVKAKPVFCPNRKCIFVTTLQGSCISVCEETGNIKFHCNTDNPIFGAPCLFRDLVIWADVKGNVYFKNIDNLKMVSTFKASGFIFSSLHLYKNYILFGCNNHNVYCLNCDNYEPLFTINIDSQIISTPYMCIVNYMECFVVANNRGRLHLYDFEKQQLLGMINLPGETFSSPIVKDGFIYIGCRDDNVYCIEIIKNR